MGFGKQKVQHISPGELQTMQENEMGAEFHGGREKGVTVHNGKDTSILHKGMKHGDWENNAGGKTQTEVDPGPRSKG